MKDVKLQQSNLHHSILHLNYYPVGENNYLGNDAVVYCQTFYDVCSKCNCIFTLIATVLAQLHLGKVDINFLMRAYWHTT